MRRLTFNILILPIIFLALSCSENHIQRGGIEHEDDDTGKDTTSDSRDKIEILDETPRFIYGDFELRSGEPGILYVVENEATRATLRNLDTNDYAQLSVRERVISFNGKIIAEDVTLIKEDTIKKIRWYKGTPSDKSVLYFVFEDF